MAAFMWHSAFSNSFAALKSPFLSHCPNHFLCPTFRPANHKSSYANPTALWPRPRPLCMPMWSPLSSSSSSLSSTVSSSSSAVLNLMARLFFSLLFLLCSSFSPCSIIVVFLGFFYLEISERVFLWCIFELSFILLTCTIYLHPYFSFVWIFVVKLTRLTNHLPFWVPL